MAKHHPDLIFCRKQPGVGTYLYCSYIVSLYVMRNLRNCPQKLRERAYTSMCRSVLEYASPILDPYLQRDINSLERRPIQRKAARFTTRDFRQRSSVTAMIRSLQWEPLAERRTKARVILMYLILNDEVAIPISPSILQPGLQGRFIQPTHHYQQYKHSFYPRTIRNWNLLPSKLKDSPSLDSFKTDYQSVTTNLCRAGTSSSL